MAIEHVTPAGANLFAELGFNPEEAENLRIRASLMSAAIRIVRERGLRQKQAADVFGVSQPRVSDLMRGKIDAFTIDSLVNMLARAGVTVDVSVREAA